MDKGLLSPEEEMMPAIVSSVDDTKLCRSLKDEFEMSAQMKIFLRLRPFTVQEIAANLTSTQACIYLKSDKEVVAVAPVKTGRSNYIRDSKQTNLSFTFSKVFDGACRQREFFNGAIQENLQKFLSGHNCLIFAYGATNSGKTYTIQGTTEHPGIIPMSLARIFQKFEWELDVSCALYKPLSDVSAIVLSKEEMQETTKTRETFFGPEANNSAAMSNSGMSSLGSESIGKSMVMLWVSFLEIYNEQLFDLLGDDRKKLSLIHDSAGNTFVRGLSKVLVRTLAETQKLLSLGQQKLHVSATVLNNKSSRSHCIYTLYVVHLIDGHLDYVNSLSFCDLAGSERVIKTQNTGDRLKEAGSINTSLLVLGRCIEALKSNQATRDRNIVPFRESKLTRLFQSYFSGKGTASMVVNVAPTSSMFDDTLNTLKFSSLAKQVVLKENMEKSSVNLSTTERLTNFWIRSNRRLSSVIGASQRSTASIASIPDEQRTFASSQTIEEGDEDSQDGEFEDLLETVRTLEEEKERLEKERDEIETRVRLQVCNEFENLMKTMEADHESFVAKQRAIDRTLLDKRTDMLQKVIDDLQEQLREYEEVEEENVAIEQESQTLIETLKSELSSTREELTKSKNDKQLRQEASSNNELDSISDELAKARNQIEQLGSQVLDAEQLIDSLKHELSLSSDSLERSRSDVTQLRREASMAQQFIENLRCELKLEISDSRDELQKSRAEVDRLKRMTSKMDKVISEQQEKNLQLESDLDKLGNILLEKDSELDVKRKEAEEAKADWDLQVKNIRSEVNDLQEKLRQAVVEKKKLEQELEDLEDSQNFKKPVNSRQKRKEPRSELKLRLSTDDESLAVSPLAMIQAAISPTLNSLRTTITNTVGNMVNKMSGAKVAEGGPTLSATRISTRSRKKLFQHDDSLFVCSPSKVAKVDVLPTSKVKRSLRLKK